MSSSASTSKHTGCTGRLDCSNCPKISSKNPEHVKLFANMDEETAVKVAEILAQKMKSAGRHEDAEMFSKIGKKK